MTEINDEKKQPRDNSAPSVPKKKPRLITEFFKSANASASKPKSKPKPKPKPIDNATKIETTRIEAAKEIPNEEIGISQTEVSETNVNIDSTNPKEVKVKDDATIPESDIAYKEEDYDSFCAKYNFNKEDWVRSLTPEQRDLLDLEIKYLHITWLVFIHKTLTKPYFLNLKRFLKSQSNKTIFPPQNLIYSWSHLTPLPNVKCLILGQDPYHNFNQAHGLAFSVLEPTRPPPSLLNIYKTLKIDFPNFEVPEYEKLAKQGKPGGGNLTKWAKRGILMLNACLTVEAHQANSHSNKGWETFTEEVIGTAIKYHTGKSGFVIMAWGTPAQNRVKKFSALLNNNSFLVLRTVHPSPLSARRGFFESNVFKKCNQWLQKRHLERIDWGLLDGNIVK